MQHVPLPDQDEARRARLFAGGLDAHATADPIDLEERQEVGQTHQGQVAFDGLTTARGLVDGVEPTLAADQILDDSDDGVRLGVRRKLKIPRSAQARFVVVAEEEEAGAPGTRIGPQDLRELGRVHQGQVHLCDDQSGTLP